MFAIPGWATLLLVALTAVGVWSSLRTRIPVWLLVILTVVLAPVGGLLLTIMSIMIYASITAG